MTKDILIDTIGKLFVDQDFRNEFNNNMETTIGNISGLNDEEKKFLKDMANKIRECTDALGIRYEGQNKRS